MNKVSNQSNKVVKITLTGGLIGLFIGNAIDTLNKNINEENSNGWEVVQIMPDTNTNLAIVVVRILLLICTFLLYTTDNGYFIVYKTNNPLIQSPIIDNNNSSLSNKLSCNKCKQPININDSFCENCGNKI